ncbi:MAG: hypothetical protein HQL83_00690 [Magnetococcales bacterium]|nr:hypothetical protein [Magnetococcales bacterium]
MAGTALRDFVRQQHEKVSKTPNKEIDWDGRRTAWIEQVESLLDRIKKWLLPLYKEALLDLVEGKTTLEEEFIGRYEVPWLEVLIGRQRARIIPKGTLVIGSFGRVDLEGPMGKLLLVLSDTGTSPKVTVHVSVGDPFSVQPEDLDEEKRSSVEMIKKSQWYFVYPDDRKKLTPLTEDTFSDALQRVLRP